MAALSRLQHKAEMKAENLQTDEELALEARNGSEVAFNELVDRYAQTVYPVGTE